MSSTVKKCLNHSRRNAKWRHPKEGDESAVYLCAPCHTGSGCLDDKSYPSRSTKARAKASKRKGSK